MIDRRSVLYIFKMVRRLNIIIKILSNCDNFVHSWRFQMWLKYFLLRLRITPPYLDDVFHFADIINWIRAKSLIQSWSFHNKDRNCINAKVSWGQNISFPGGPMRASRWWQTQSSNHSILLRTSYDSFLWYMYYKWCLEKVTKRRFALCSINPSLYESKPEFISEGKKNHSIIIRSQPNVLSWNSETPVILRFKLRLKFILYTSRGSHSALKLSLPTCAETGTPPLGAYHRRICHWDPGAKSLFSSPRGSCDLC